MLPFTHADAANRLIARHIAAAAEDRHMPAAA
jgi:hypothetical protein